MLVASVLREISVIGVVSWISGANHHVFLVHPNIEPEHGPLPCRSSWIHLPRTPSDRPK